MRTLFSIRTLFLALILAAVPAASFAGVFVNISVAPPALPVYVQPPCPTPGYLWTPGYWAYGPAGYYWVPGVWAAPPSAGLLWTPGYWGFAGGLYLWHAGYWGPHVGFYGGVNYGFGYPGAGFIGGRWNGGHFFYNTAVMHVNTTVIHNTYIDRTVVRNTVVNRASFNGPGGINARPTREEQSFARDQHFQATSEQAAHERTASFNRGNFASENGGRPATPAMSRPAYNNARPAYNARPANNGAERPAYNARPANNEARQQPHANESRPANGGGEHRGGGNERGRR